MIQNKGIPPLMSHCHINDELNTRKSLTWKGAAAGGFSRVSSKYVYRCTTVCSTYVRMYDQFVYRCTMYLYRTGRNGRDFICVFFFSIIFYFTLSPLPCVPPPPAHVGIVHLPLTHERVRCCAAHLDPACDARVGFRHRNAGQKPVSAEPVLVERVLFPRDLYKTGQRGASGSWGGGTRPHIWK